MSICPLGGLWLLVWEPKLTKANVPAHLNIGVIEIATECGMRDRDGRAGTPQLSELPQEREQEGGSVKGPRGRGQLLETAGDCHLRGLWSALEVGSTVGQTGIHKPHAKFISATSRTSFHIVCEANSCL